MRILALLAVSWLCLFNAATVTNAVEPQRLASSKLASPRNGHRSSLEKRGNAGKIRRHTTAHSDDMGKEAHIDKRSPSALLPDIAPLLRGRASMAVLATQWRVAQGLQTAQRQELQALAAKVNKHGLITLALHTAIGSTVIVIVGQEVAQHKRQDNLCAVTDDILNRLARLEQSGGKVKLEYSCRYGSGAEPPHRFSLTDLLGEDWARRYAGNGLPPSWPQGQHTLQVLGVLSHHPTPSPPPVLATDPQASEAEQGRMLQKRAPSGLLDLAQAATAAAEEGRAGFGRLASKLQPTHNIFDETVKAGDALTKQAASGEKQAEAVERLQKSLRGAKIGLYTVGALATGAVGYSVYSNVNHNKALNQLAQENRDITVAIAPMVQAMKQAGVYDQDTADQSQGGTTAPPTTNSTTTPPSTPPPATQPPPPQQQQQPKTQPSTAPTSTAPNNTNTGTTGTSASS